jgi:hypothetical protein
MKQSMGAGAHGLLVVGMLLAACSEGDRGENEQRDERADASGAASISVLPTSEQLCTLTPGESDESELRAVFGEPDDVQQGPDKVLRYRFEDESEWQFYVD